MDIIWEDPQCHILIIKASKDFHPICRIIPSPLARASLVPPINPANLKYPMWVAGKSVQLMVFMMVPLITMSYLPLMPFGVTTVAVVPTQRLQQETTQV
jgi:hypothetical protein